MTGVTPSSPGAAVPRYPELSGRVAVVTGAARGIGEGIARRLAREGMRIVAVDVDREALTASVAALGDGAIAVHADLGLPADVDRVFERAVDALGTVDVLVNNAADLRRVRLLDEHDELLERQLATNVRGPYRCAQRAAPIMRAGGGGSIIHLSSVGALRAHHRGFPYDVTKGAVNAMTLAMAVDLGEYGIRVNAVAPGVTRTHLTERYSDPAAEAETARRIPLRRPGTVGDVASLVAFLASDESAYVTGQIIAVDGGITAQLSPQGRSGLERTDRDGWTDERIESP